MNSSWILYVLSSLFCLRLVWFFIMYMIYAAYANHQMRIIDIYGDNFIFFHHKILSPFSIFFIVVSILYTISYPTIFRFAM